ncbi:50S ribosomal protein L29 [Candidatus Peregrinibacteria bacterium]|nr:50S ribosomal protein L29 [Candidatus Peregrinibacteria bacterium]
MTATTTITELRAMPISDLRKELRIHQTHVRKMRLQITMNTEKDTGRYRREKKQIARMMMVLGEKTDLKKEPKTATVSVRKKAMRSS